MKRAFYIFMMFIFCALPLVSQDEGDEENKIYITGRVMDSAGKPISDYPVDLIVERAVLDLSSFGNVVSKRKVFSTKTDYEGNYVFTWTLDDYFNRFYIDYLVKDKFDDVRFQPPLEPLIDASRSVGKGKDFTHRLVILYHPDWFKLKQVIEVHGGVNTDKGKVLREHGFFDKETEEELLGIKYKFWWYYYKGKAFKFRDDKLVKKFTYSPLKPMVDND